MSYGSYSFKDVSLWYHIPPCSKRYQTKELENQIYLCLTPNYWLILKIAISIEDKNYVTWEYDHFKNMKIQI